MSLLVALKSCNFPHCFVALLYTRNLYVYPPAPPLAVAANVTFCPILLAVVLAVAFTESFVTDCIFPIFTLTTLLLVTFPLLSFTST